MHASASAFRKEEKGHWLQSLLDPLNKELLRVLLRPLPRRLVVARTVCFINVSYLRHQGIVCDEEHSPSLTKITKTARKDAIEKRALESVNYFALPGLGSVRSEDIDRSTLLIVRAGLHWSFKISRQIAP